jgi:hypothetical protein
MRKFWGLVLSAVDQAGKTVVAHTVLLFVSKVIKWIVLAIAAILIYLYVGFDKPENPKIEKNFRMEVGNQIYDGKPRVIEGPVFLIPGEDSRTCTVFGLRDGVLEISGATARCKETGEVVSNKIKISTTNHNVLVITGDDTDGEGRVLEIVFSAVGLASGKASVEAVEQAVNEHFFFPVEAKTTLLASHRNPVNR